MRHLEHGHGGEGERAPSRGTCCRRCSGASRLDARSTPARPGGTDRRGTLPRASARDGSRCGPASPTQSASPAMLRMEWWCVNSSTCPGQSNSTYFPAHSAEIFSSSQSRFFSRYSMQYTSPAIRAQPRAPPWRLPGKSAPSRRPRNRRAARRSQGPDSQSLCRCRRVALISVRSTQGGIAGLVWQRCQGRWLY